MADGNYFNVENQKLRIGGEKLTMKKKICVAEDYSRRWRLKVGVPASPGWPNNNEG